MSQKTCIETHEVIVINGPFGKALTFETAAEWGWVQTAIFTKRLDRGLK